MTPFTWDFPYASQRMPVLAANVVATSHPLAAQAGARALLKGGNAVDAILATAITLTVVEPTMNGIGSDAFALVWDGTRLHGLNASGRAPRAWTPERFAGLQAMPRTGWDSVTVPGAVSAWVALSAKFGRLPFAQLFAASLEYAERGFLVSPIVARQWQTQGPQLQDQPGFAAAFLPGGRAPYAGELFRHPAQARTLQAIAESRGEAFYRGALAEKIAAASRAQGGAMTTEDLAAHEPDWVEPIGQDYRDLRLHEIPPNGQGIAALMMLGILEHFDLTAAPVDSADSVHLQMEAMKLAFADAYRYVADPKAMTLSSEQLLDPSYLRQRAALIDRTRAQDFAHGVPPSSGTVYLTAADASGMMVSYIQSNYSGFGSGVVVPDTGISMQNRGFGFSLAPGHPNQVAPVQAAVSHHHPGVCYTRWETADELRPDGRRHAAAGPCPDARTPCRLRSEPAGCGRRPAVEGVQRATDRGRARALAPGRGTTGAARARGPAHRAVEHGVRCSPVNLSRGRRVRGRLGSSARWRGGRFLTRGYYAPLG